MISWTDKGLFCEAGGFYIDPHRAVDLSVITHAHSDHAKKGCKKYICETTGVQLLKTRIGFQCDVHGIPYRVPFRLGEVQVSFHSAGHILGSAQIRIQKGHEVWVVSGDYKREPDPSCEPFEVVPCDTFITEATFGTPRYIWDTSLRHGELIFQWWKENAAHGFNSILFGYSLGKAQRILAELEEFADRPVLIHDSMAALTQCYREVGRQLALTRELSSLSSQEPIFGELILAPPSILKTSWQNRFGKYKTAFASGWMVDMWQSNYDQGFVISDHADWKGLNQTIQETGARRVFVLHRGNGALVKHLKKQGLEAYPISVLSSKPNQNENLTFEFASRIVTTI